MFKTHSSLWKRRNANGQEFIARLLIFIMVPYQSDLYQDEFDEAVTEALDWFGSKRVGNRKRLFLDFRQLIIGDGIQAEQLAQKIQQQVPPDVEIHLSLKCCRVEEGGLGVLQRFLSSVPNLTFLNVTFLWFDYEEITTVVLSASNLRELELPLGQQSGIASVIQACGDQLENFRFFSGGLLLTKHVVEEATMALQKRKNLKSLEFASFRCNDDSFHGFVSNLGRVCTLERLRIACDGGSMTSRSLSALTRLLHTLPSTIKLKLSISDNPELFQNATRAQLKHFLGALSECRSLQSLSLEHVGLTSSQTQRILQSLEVLQTDSLQVTLCGTNLLPDQKAFAHLTQSISRMTAVECLAVIDDFHSQVEMTTENAFLLAEAVHSNHSIQHLTLQVGGEYIFSPILDEIFDRNKALKAAQDGVGQAARDAEFSSALWTRAVANMRPKAGDFAADPIHILIKNMVISQALDSAAK